MFLRVKGDALHGSIEGRRDPIPAGQSGSLRRCQKTGGKTGCKQPEIPV
nr:MAG TPA: hypothetical protein [Caudoviricetes sp.]